MTSAPEHLKIALLLIGLSFLAIGNCDWNNVAAQGAAPAPQQQTQPGGPIVGGEAPMNLADQNDRDKAYSVGQYCTTEQNRRSNSQYLHVLDEVQWATKQVVSGIRYHLKFTTSQSTCLNTPAYQSAAPGTCQRSNEANAARQVCEASVVEQLWKRNPADRQRIIDLSCAPA